MVTGTSKRAMSKSWEPQLKAVIDAQFDTFVQLRRHLHKYPEPSGEESQTSFRIYRELGDRGFEVSLGPEGCGVVADLGNSKAAAGAGPGMIALRADLDALQIQRPEFVNDFPLGAGRFIQRAVGVRHTLVNGQPFMEDGEHTGALAGRVLRSTD